MLKFKNKLKKNKKLFPLSSKGFAKQFHTFRPIIWKFHVRVSNKRDLPEAIKKFWEELKDLYKYIDLSDDEHCFNLHVVNECSFASFEQPVDKDLVDFAIEYSKEQALSFGANNLFSLGSIPCFDKRQFIGDKIAGYNIMPLFEGGTGASHLIYKLEKSSIDDWPMNIKVLEGDSLPSQKRILEFCKEGSGNRIVYVPQICLENALGVGVLPYKNVVPIAPSIVPIVSLSAWGTKAKSHDMPQILIISDGFDQVTSEETTSEPEWKIPGTLAVLNFGVASRIARILGSVTQMSTLVNDSKLQNHVLNFFRSSGQKVTVLELTSGKKVVIGPKLKAPLNPTTNLEGKL